MHRNPCIWLSRAQHSHRTCLNPGYVSSPQRHEGVLEAMALLLSTLFWDKKLKIAVLTMATFAALC